MSKEHSATLDLARQLIAIESVSPVDGGCQKLMADFLEPLGFDIHFMPFEDVTNLWAIRRGNRQGPVFAFAGHTDVVPTGPLHEWKTNPFEPVVTEGLLFGRGAADMKGSLAAMLTATEKFLNQHQDYDGAIAFLITSDEEADAINGTVKVIEALENDGQHIDWCLVGEPSSSKTLGDVIRVGRRGSLNGQITVNGVQGHVAYPDQAVNPIHMAAGALQVFTSESWDNGNNYFPATSMQISNIHAGTGVNNVVPGSLDIVFNFRFSTESSVDSLKTRTQALLDATGIDYNISWSLSGNPFLTEGGELIPAVQKVLRRLDVEPELSTSGGTSDGRFIAPFGTQVVELGPCNATIHKINECVSIEELDRLSHVYADVLTELFGSDD